MLNDRGGGGIGEFFDEFQRAVQVVEVVETDFLAAVVAPGRIADAGGGYFWVAVEGGLLVRVFAVAQDVCAGIGQAQGRRKTSLTPDAGGF